MKQREQIRMTFDILRSQGAGEAYGYLTQAIGLAEPEDRAALYPYCVSLAVLCGKTAEALAILQFAVKTEGFWYLPEVFDNSELDDIRDETAFVACRELSEKQYEKARSEAQTYCTWQGKTDECIALALHGNGENWKDAREAWGFFRDRQVEYLQSREPDRWGVYCWEDDTDSWRQIPETCGKIGWTDYRERTLCGYGAACNAILRAVARGETPCQTLILYAPWLPMLMTGEADQMLKQLKEQGTTLYLLCGTEDETCLSQAQRLARETAAAGIPCRTDWIEGQDHDIPADLAQRVTALLGA